jgi:hypothetical protein
MLIAARSSQTLLAERRQPQARLKYACALASAGSGDFNEFRQPML